MRAFIVASLVIAVVVAEVSASAALDPKFVVVMHGRNSQIISKPGTITVPMVGHDGKKYQCAIPPPPTVKSNEAAFENADSELSLLSDLEGQCLLHLTGWWTYEYCYKKSVKQFHQEPNSKQIMNEFYLGKQVDGESHPEETVKDGGKPAAKKKEYFARSYKDGTPCDLTKVPRTTEVRFVCGQENAHQIVGIKEPSTCNYVLTVATPLLCAHPAYAPEEEPVSQINCVRDTEPSIWEDSTPPTIEELADAKTPAANSAEYMRPVLEEALRLLAEHKDTPLADSAPKTKQTSKSKDAKPAEPAFRHVGTLRTGAAGEVGVHKGDEVSAGTKGPSATNNDRVDAAGPPLKANVVDEKVTARETTTGTVEEEAAADIMNAARTEVVAKAEQAPAVNAKAELEAKAKAEQEAKAKAEQQAKTKAEQEARAKAEQEAKAKAEQEAKAKAEQEAKAKAEQEAKAKAEQEVKTKAEHEAKAKAEQEAKAKAEQEEQEVKAKAEHEAKAKAEQEAKAKAEHEAKAKAEQEAKAKAEQEAKVKAEQEAKTKAEHEAKAKAEHEAKAKAEQEAKAKAEQEAKAKAEQEAKTKAGHEAKAKAEQEAKAKAEQEAKTKAGHEAKAKTDQEMRTRAEQAKAKAQRDEAEEAAAKSKAPQGEGKTQAQAKPELSTTAQAIPDAKPTAEQGSHSKPVKASQSHTSAGKGAQDVNTKATNQQAKAEFPIKATTEGETSEPAKDKPEPSKTKSPSKTSGDANRREEL